MLNHRINSSCVMLSSSLSTDWSHDSYWLAYFTFHLRWSSWLITIYLIFTNVNTLNTKQIQTCIGFPENFGALIFVKRYSEKPNTIKVIGATNECNISPMCTPKHKALLHECVNIVIISQTHVRLDCMTHRQAMFSAVWKTNAFFGQLRRKMNRCVQIGRENNGQNPIESPIDWISIVKGKWLHIFAFTYRQR